MRPLAGNIIVAFGETYRVIRAGDGLSVNEDGLKLWYGESFTGDGLSVHREHIGERDGYQLQQVSEEYWRIPERVGHEVAFVPLVRVERVTRPTTVEIAVDDSPAWTDELVMEYADARVEWALDTERGNRADPEQPPPPKQWLEQRGEG